MFGEIGDFGQGGEVVFDAFALQTAAALGGVIGSAHNLFEIANAEVIRRSRFGKDFVAVLALRLKAAEFGGGPIKKTAGLGAVAVDGGLAAGGGIVIESGEGGFGEAAAAETPEGADDFFEQVLFEDGGGGEFGVERFFEFCGDEGVLSGRGHGVTSGDRVDDG